MSQEEYACEYAKSDRSRCKLCKSTINQTNLRLAIYVQSPFFDGKIPNWYHYTCFFKKATPSDTCYIKGFDSLRWDDQQRIKEKLGLGSGLKSKDDESFSVDQYSIDYPKTSRSKCKKCDLKIETKSLRIGIKGSKSNIDGFYHLECFSKNKQDYGFNFNAEEITGYADLDKNDASIVETSIGAPIEKRKHQDEPDINDGLDPEAKRLKKEQLEKEKELKAQSIDFWKLRDKLDKEIPTEDIKLFLQENKQDIKLTGRDDLLTFLTDCMYFGPLEKCPECKNGQLVYRSFAYCCTGNITEWTKCRYKTQTPDRIKSLNISSDFKENYPVFKNFKYQFNTRIFANKLTNSSENDEIKKESEESTKPKPPLFRLNFSSFGKLNRNNQQIKAIIERLGGIFSSKTDATTIAVVSNEDEVKKMNKKIREIKSLDIHIVSEAFIDDLTKSDSFQLEPIITKHKISDWGSDIKTRMELSIKSHEKKKTDEEQKFTIKSGDGTGKIKMKLKGGAAVDPESGLEGNSHVLLSTPSNDPYTCVLGLVDIIRGSNSYYKLQIIELDDFKSHYVFRSWGRVGTTIGGNKLEEFGDKKEAIDFFKQLYLEKTGNEWSSRRSATKQANKFYPLEIDYGEDDDKVDSKMSDKNFVSSSTLAKPIQEIIKMIFDIKKMKDQMKEFELDLNKMPLGKISSNQIKQAFSVLNEISQLIDNKSNETLFIDASNRFYTLIPHDFGLKKPTILNDSKLVKEKTDMLNSLLDIEIAYNILKMDVNDQQDPIDVHYKKLSCDMDVLDHNSQEFKRLVEYVKNTHANSHGYYKLVVKDIFKIKRSNEEVNYEKFKSLHNKKLLWHGSRLTNFAGILSQGLRIAPPEAPSTGYMFGKGVYFADMVSKSANYCFTNKENPTGLMLLCEVALGDMYERLRSEYVTKLPNGKHCTKGCGRTMPDPKESFFTEDGVEIPMGKGTSSNNNSALLYNEFIVYDTSQVVMRYLLRVHFDYN